MRPSYNRRPGFSFREISPNFWILFLGFVGASLLLYFIPGKGTAILFVALGWVVSVCVHEFGHALAAFYGGDYEMIDKGYLTLDPFNYVHPLLSIVMPIIFLLMGGIGLPGGAVYINPNRLRSDAWRSFTSAAGLLGTLACLLVLWLPLRLGLPNWFGPEEFWGAWTFLAYIEITALVLNLLPIPGIDGFGIAAPWLPPNWVDSLNMVRPYAFILLYAALQFGPIAQLFGAQVNQLARLFQLNGHLLGIGYNLFQLFR